MGFKLGPSCSAPCGPGPFLSPPPHCGWSSLYHLPHRCSIAEAASGDDPRSPDVNMEGRGLPVSAGADVRTPEPRQASRGPLNKFGEPPVPGRLRALREIQSPWLQHSTGQPCPGLQRPSSRSRGLATNPRRARYLPTIPCECRARSPVHSGFLAVQHPSATEWVGPWGQGAWHPHVLAKPRRPFQVSAWAESSQGPNGVTVRRESNAGSFPERKSLQRQSSK